MASFRMTRSIGAIPAPPGVKPNFDNPPNRDHLIYTVSSICLVLSTVSVLLRLYTRIMIVKRHSWEDYSLTVGGILAIIYHLMMPLGIKIGAGVHAYDLTSDRFETFLKRSNLTDLLYNLTAISVKLSIVFQIQHIFTPNRKSPLYYTLIVIAVLTTIFYSVCFFVRLFQCTPREKIWNPSVEGHCIDTPVAILSSAVFNIVFDFVFLVLPIRSIWKLQMSSRKKWGITSIFAVGLFACVSSIMRTIASISLIHTEDITWRLIDVGVWCDAEITSGILCCCLPVFPQFYRKILTPILSSILTRLPTNRTSGIGTAPIASRDSGARRYPWETPNGLVKKNFIELSGVANGTTVSSFVLDSASRADTNNVSKFTRSEETDVENGIIMKTIRIESKVDDVK